MRQKRLNEVNADKGKGTQRQRENSWLRGKSIDISGCHMRCGSVLISIFEF